MCSQVVETNILMEIVNGSLLQHNITEETSIKRVPAHFTYKYGIYLYLA